MCFDSHTIFGFKYRASTRSRLQALKIRLENKSRIGTQIRRNLEDAKKSLNFCTLFKKKFDADQAEVLSQRSICFMCVIK